MKWTAKAFSGGALATVMAEAMLTGKPRPKFAALAGEPGTRRAAPVDAWETYFGWRPAPELEEWCAVEPAYGKLVDSISDSWMFANTSGWRACAKKPPPPAVNESGFILTAVTGLELFGRDPSGDSCFVSTLPTESNLAEVFVVDHETGKLSGTRSASIAHFVAAHFSPTDGSIDDPRPPWHETQRAFDEAWEKTLQKRAITGAPWRLFERSEWLFELPTGDPGFAFAEKLGAAPTFATWEKERGLLGRHPVLANYWMLAHYFLGNAEACREAVAIGKACAGKVTPALAAIVLRLLDEPAKAKLGRLTPDKIAPLRAATAKNCDPAQLAKATSASGKPVAKSVTSPDVVARLDAGQDGWMIIQELHDDVAAHDLVLAALAKGDKRLQATVDAYFRERSGGAYNQWPYRAAQYDRRFTPAVAAAFRSGLRYDADHKKAFAALANTLAFADDDVAVAAYREAIERLDAHDDRLEHVIEALRKSAHPLAAEVLERGALRFFETLEGAAARLAKKDADGPNLNNIFSVETHLVQALHILLRRRDDRAHALAKRTLSWKTNLRIFGTCLGHAVRVCAERGDRDCLPLVEGYLGTVLAHWDAMQEGDENRGEDHVVLNAGECALALARLSPLEAGPRLAAAFEKKRASACIDLDARAAMLAGLVLLEPEKEAWLVWLERILGNRSGAIRVFAALRAVQEAQVKRAAPWVRGHLYGRRVSLNKRQMGNWLLPEAARDALAALGEERAPPFDGTDAFASAVPTEELAAALGHPERHYIGSVFQRIREKACLDRAVVKEGSTVLREWYRFSGDDYTRIGVDERFEGVRALLLQGASSAPVFGELLGLPHLAPGDRTFLVVAQRFSGQERVVRGWLGAASESELLAELAAPRPSFRAFTDLVAARAVVDYPTEATRSACLAAFERRLGELAAPDHCCEHDVALVQLGHLVARFDRGREVVLRWSQAPSFYRLADALKSAVRVARDASPEFDGQPLALGLTFAGNVNQLTLTVEDRDLRWESMATGYTGGMHGIFPSGTMSARGTVTLASAESAMTYGKREVEAAVMLGYRPIPPARAEPKKRKG